MKIMIMITVSYEKQNQDRCVSVMLIVGWLYAGSFLLSSRDHHLKLV